MRAENDNREARERGGTLYTPLGSVKATVNSKFSSHWKRLREPGSEDEVRQKRRKREGETVRHKSGENSRLSDRRIATEQSRSEMALIIYLVQ